MVLVVGVVLPAQAGPVYRCEEGGQVTYTDRPCDAAAVPYELPGGVVVARPVASQVELARQFDQRIERGRAARDRVDRAWVKKHREREDRAARVRKAIIEHRAIRGMTMDEVKQALGPPDRRQKSESHGSHKETWIYEGEGGRRRVNFKDGAVSTHSRREKETR